MPVRILLHQNSDTDSQFNTTLYIAQKQYTERKEGTIHQPVNNSATLTSQFLHIAKLQAFGYVDIQRKISLCSVWEQGVQWHAGREEENSNIIRGEEGRSYIPELANSKKPLKGKPEIYLKEGAMFIH